MHKKAAIELSVNFLVIIILAIVIVGFSFFIFFTVFMEAQDLSDLTQEQMNERIEELQCDGTVCMSSTYRKMNRGDFHLFGIKILNTGEDAEFKVIVNATDKLTLNYVPKEYEVSIEQNKAEPVAIGIKVQKDQTSGIYIFNIHVEKGGISYGNTQQIRIEVP